MSSSLGEANVINAFSKILNSELLSRKPNAEIIESNMSGKDDKVFADYFANTDSYNILIEFKSTNKKINTEKKKPLRKKLCEEINQYFYTSTGCHYIAWGDNIEKEINIFLDNYIYQVCPLFGIDLGKSSDVEKAHDFVNSFLDKNRGLKNSSFMQYIDFLVSLQDDPDGGSDFHAIYYSYSDGKLVSLPVHGNLKEILKLIKKPIEISKKQNNLNNVYSRKKPYDKKPGKGGMSPGIRRSRGKNIKVNSKKHKKRINLR